MKSSKKRKKKVPKILKYNDGGYAKTVGRLKQLLESGSNDFSSELQMAADKLGIDPRQLMTSIRGDSSVTPLSNNTSLSDPNNPNTANVINQIRDSNRVDNVNSLPTQNHYGDAKKYIDKGVNTVGNTINPILTAAASDVEGNGFNPLLSAGTGFYSGMQSGGVLGGLFGAASSLMRDGSAAEQLDLVRQREHEDYIRNSVVDPSIAEDGGFFHNNNGGFIPIQTEIDELLLLPDMSMPDVAADEKHKSMEDDEVTDVVPEGTFVFSHNKKQRLKPKDIADELVGGGRTFYTENKTYDIDNMLMSDVLGKKGGKITYADGARKVRNKIELVDEDSHKDAFAMLTNAENKTTRVPYLAKLIELQETSKRKGKNGSKSILTSTGGSNEADTSKKSRRKSSTEDYVKKPKTAYEKKAYAVEKFEEGGYVKKVPKMFLGGLVGMLGAGGASTPRDLNSFRHDNTSPMSGHINLQDYKLSESGMYASIPGQLGGGNMSYMSQTNNPSVRAYKKGGKVKKYNNGSFVLDGGFLDDYLRQVQGTIDENGTLVEDVYRNDLNDINGLNSTLTGLNRGNFGAQTALNFMRKNTPDYFRERARFVGDRFRGQSNAEIAQQQQANFAQQRATGASPDAALIASNQVGINARNNQRSLDMAKFNELNRVSNANESRRVDFEKDLVEDFNAKISDFSGILNNTVANEGNIARSTVMNERDARNTYLRGKLANQQSEMNLRTTELSRKLGLTKLENELDITNQSLNTLNKGIDVQQQQLAQDRTRLIEQRDAGVAQRQLDDKIKSDSKLNSLQRANFAVDQDGDDVTVRDAEGKVIWRGNKDSYLNSSLRTIKKGN